MNKRKALRLKPGAHVMCADHNDVSKARYRWVGDVVRVTENGGILVRITEGKRVGGSQDWCGPGTGPDVGTEKWFPYHHVW